MTLLLVYHRCFWLEADYDFRRYQTRLFELGKEFLDEIGKAISEIQADPSQYALASATIRQAPVGQFPFSINYCIKSDHIRILSVWHHKRGTSGLKSRQSFGGSPTMTEAEWLGATDTRPMLKLFGKHSSNRKGRLLLVAYSRKYSELLGRNSITCTGTGANDSASDSETLEMESAQSLRDGLGSLVKFIHCIIGNPFRPVVADPAWLTPTVLSIASSIYQEHTFDRLPTLADALGEVGCTNADVLLHCRQPGEHVRGCWVVDLILGKA